MCIFKAKVQKQTRHTPEEAIRAQGKWFLQPSSQEQCIKFDCCWHLEDNFTRVRSRPRRISHQNPNTRSQQDHSSQAVMTTQVNSNQHFGGPCHHIQKQTKTHSTPEDSSTDTVVVCSVNPVLAKNKGSIDIDNTR